MVKQEKHTSACAVSCQSCSFHSQVGWPTSLTGACATGCAMQVPEPPDSKLSLQFKALRAAHTLVGKRWMSVDTVVKTSVQPAQGSASCRFLRCNCWTAGTTFVGGHHQVTVPNPVPPIPFSACPRSGGRSSQVMPVCRIRQQQTDVALASLLPTGLYV